MAKTKIEKLKSVILNCGRCNDISCDAGYSNECPMNTKCGKNIWHSYEDRRDYAIKLLKNYTSKQEEMEI